MSVLSMTRPDTLPDGVDEVAAVAAAHARDNDDNATFPLDALDAMRRTGLLGLMVPAEHGGRGGTVDDVVTASIALGRADMSVAMIFAMHCQQAAAVVQHAREPLRTPLLAAIARGDCYLASVTTEAGTGGHLMSAGTELTTTAGGHTIDRFAPIVTGGAHADGFLITMAAGPQENGVSLVYAARADLGIEQSGDWQPLGMRASHSVAMRLRGAVPAVNVIGGTGGFATIAVDVFAPMAHLGWSAAWLGTAAGALSRTVAVIRGRRGGAVRSELLLSRLSRARQRIDAVHALLRHTTAAYRRAAAAGQVGETGMQLLLNSLKITASEQCLAAVDDLIDAVGLRDGYLRGSSTGLERALRDLRSAPLNYSNDRLHLADGRLALIDREVRLV